MKIMCIFMGIGFWANLAVAEEPESFFASIQNGQSQLKLRQRYEHVDQDNFAEQADASTLLVRLNFGSQSYRGIRFFVEADHVTEFFADDYNSGAGTSPGRTQFPVVADPTGTEINQAWVSWANEANGIKIGRQRINLDDQRFVGGVGWRQNEQTYDAFSAHTDVLSGKFFAAYVRNVNRIFGDDVPAGDHRHDTVLLNWSNNWDGHKLTAYYYGIDNETVAALSSQTLGLRYQNQWAVGDNQLLLDLGWATQSDHADNPNDYSAQYQRLQLSLKTQRATWFVGTERLHGDDEGSFSTPLATLHAFNGWSDRFLATPLGGLEDTYIGVKGKHNGHSWLLKYHLFDAESVGLSYGDEINAQWGYRINKLAHVLAKMAIYNADDFSVDTTKFWLMFTFDFNI